MVKSRAAWIELNWTYLKSERTIIIECNYKLLRDTATIRVLASYFEFKFVTRSLIFRFRGNNLDAMHDARNARQMHCPIFIYHLQSSSLNFNFIVVTYLSTKRNMSKSKVTGYSVAMYYI